jgi:hypothetical protein
VERECSCGWYKFPIIMPQNIVLTHSEETCIHSCVFKQQTFSNVQVKLNMGREERKKINTNQTMKIKEKLGRF